MIDRARCADRRDRVRQRAARRRADPARPAARGGRRRAVGCARRLDPRPLRRQRRHRHAVVGVRRRAAARRGRSATRSRIPRRSCPRAVSSATARCPELGWIDVHIGVLLVLVVVPVAAWLMSSTRLGFLVRAHGGNRTATTSNEVRPARLPFALIVLSGALAGIAGFVQLAGVQNRVATGSAAGFGFTAIIVAIVRAHQPRRRPRVGARILGDARRRRGGAAREWPAGQPDADDPGADRRVRRRRRRRCRRGCGLGAATWSPSGPLAAAACWRCRDVEHHRARPERPRDVGVLERRPRCRACASPSPSVRRRSVR